MTAEERLAYFQGEKRRSTVYEAGKSERKIDTILFRVKFFIAVILFVAFLTLDYTGYEIYGITSERIIQEICSDFNLNAMTNNMYFSLE